MEIEAKRINKETSTTNETLLESELYRNPTQRKDPKNTTADKSDNTAERNKSKDIGKKEGTQKVPAQCQTI